MPVARQTVWDALNDLEVLRMSIPGCESISAVGENDYEVAMQAAVGPVKAKFKGRMKIENIEAPHGYTLQFEGSGGAAGFARGTARVQLEAPAEDETVLRYSSSANVGGKLAQIGSRLIDSASRMMAEKFFTAFVAHPKVSGVAADAGGAAEPGTPSLRARMLRVLGRENAAG